MKQGDIQLGEWTLRGVLLVSNCKYTLISERKSIQQVGGFVEKHVGERIWVTVTRGDHTRGEVASDMFVIYSCDHTP